MDVHIENVANLNFDNTADIEKIGQNVELLSVRLDAMQEKMKDFEALLDVIMKKMEVLTGEDDGQHIQKE